MKMGLNMIDLKRYSGIEFMIDETYGMVLGRDVSLEEKSVRKISDMKDILSEVGAFSGDDGKLYYMYREVACVAHKTKIREFGVRYDITVIPQGLLGNEYIKTAGHYHAVDKKTGLEFAEIYEVLHGRALYLLQKLNETKDVVVDAYLVYALPGDKVVIPPGFGHITINPFSDTLVMANWVAADWASNYFLIKKRHGAAWFVEKNISTLPAENKEKPNSAEYTIDDSLALRIIRNCNWQIAENLKLKIISAADILPGSLRSEKPMYLDFMEMPAKYEFLLRPELTELL